MFWQGLSFWYDNYGLWPWQAKPRPISFLGQRVHVSEILRHFSQFYSTHSRLVYDPIRTILAILYREVPHMLPAKYQPNPLGGSGEEDF